MNKILPLFFISFLYSCNNTENPENDPDLGRPLSGIPKPNNIPFSIIAQYPHDTSAYTQGLHFYNGKLYEGTGDYEASSLRITDYKTGKIEKIHKMGTNLIFGEGITILNNKLYQLTWQSNIVYVYNINNLEKPIKNLKWPYEGWGITNNGTELVISDGSANLYFVDPENLRIKNTVVVSDNAGPVDSINEMEMIDGYVYANVYEQNFIVKIDPESGHIVGKMTFQNLLQPQDNVPGRTNVLNGIAYDSISKKIFITGKRWPKLFELKLN